MPTPTPSRASSRSPSRKPTTPSSSSPHTSPKRTPLLERSDSQRNAAYRPSPFPTLPSQVFAPKGDPYVFGDELPNSRPVPAVPPKSPKRSARSSGSRSTSSAREGGFAEKSRPSDIPPLFTELPSPQASPGEKQDDTGRNRVRRRTVTSPRKSIDVTPFAGASSAVDTGESSKMGAQRVFVSARPQESTRSAESFAARRRHQQASSDGSSSALPHHKSVERLRSQSSVASKAKKRAQTGQFDSPRTSDERPRSSSSPNTPTDAFINALISAGTNIQYPKLKKPSATSLRSEAIVSGAAYPPPLRLQRKRANSQLGKAASIAAESLEPRSDEASSSLQDRLLRPAQSQASFMTHTSDGSIAWDGSYYTYAIPRWTDEAGDTVTELHPRSVRYHTPDVQSNAIRRSQQASHESLRSSVGSFYHFLNDSRTAWARVYYRGDGNLNLETPPGVEYIGPSQTPDQRRRNASQAEYDHSPGSSGFPDRIYVPRVRPFKRDAPTHHDEDTFRIQQMPIDDSSSPYNTTQTDSSILPPPIPFLQSSSSPYATSGTNSSSVPGMRTFFHSSSSPYNTVETGSSTNPRVGFLPRNYSSPQTGTEGGSSSLPQIRPALGSGGFSFVASESASITALPEVRRVEQEPLASPVFNPTPEVPHLSPSRRVGPWMPYWRAPSFDETSSPFDKSNFQLVLFCAGFLFPPAWWIAAFLPLPKRPQWQNGKEPASVYQEGSFDLFESIEVYRYQKTQWWRNLNRFMAIAGVLIVAAVIACVVVSTT